MIASKFKLVLIIFVLAVFSCNTSVDIRNAYLKNGITESDVKLGKELLTKMETAHGGRTNWERYRHGEFVQVADWYGRTKLSHWDTIPQRFKMVCELGSNNSEMVLLNGKNTGKTFIVKDDQFFEKEVNKKPVDIDQNQFYEKMIFKNYWFQFPFRIGEAAIISYGGEEEINGKQYQIVYATWGSEKANNDYDQFLLYLDKTTHRLEILYFTVRDKMKRITLTAEFKNFKNTSDFILPHSQFVRQGKPTKEGMKFHENHYQEISFR